MLIRKYGHVLKYPIERYLSCTWKPSEVDIFKKLLCQHGRNWSFLASQLNKTVKQCRDFYFYFKYQLKLPEIVRIAAYQSNKLQDHDSDSDDYFENDFKDVESDSEFFDDLRLARRNSKSRRTNSFIGADGLLSLSKRHSSSNLSLKSDCDSCATLSADEEGDITVAADIRRTEINPILMNQRVPAFLINPNAPTTNIPQLQDPSLTNLIVNQPPIDSMFNQRPPQAEKNFPLALHAQQQSTSLGVNGPEENSNGESTCVKDLIDKAIDMTLNTDSKLTSNSANQPAIALTTGNLKSSHSHRKILQPNHPNARLAYDHQLGLLNLSSRPSYPQPINHSMRSDYNQPINLHSNVQPLNLKAPVINNFENEIQDLSKKSMKKESHSSHDYRSDQPENLSLKPAHTKPKSDTYLSSGLPFISQQMPPPSYESYFINARSRFG